MTGMASHWVSVSVLAILLLSITHAFGNPPREALLPVIPQPATAGGSSVPPPALKSGGHIAAEDESLLPLARVLADEVKRVWYLDLKPTVGKAGAGDIALRLDPALKGEAYRLQLATPIVAAGGNYNAVASATTTLLQLMGERHWQTVIEDQPAYEFRSVLIDLARKYHSPDGIKQVIELARLYKVRYIHLVLSDDQLFMFPSTAFPNLGKSNRELDRFEPKTKPTVERYTLAQLKDLEQFAKDRGVHLMPEINFPGHALRMVKDAPEIFAFPGNGSTVNIADPKVVAAVETLLNEMMDVFASTPYVHLGADEVSMAGIDKTPAYQQLLKDDPKVKSPGDLYHRFINQMVEMVAKRGKKSVVWEEAFGGPKSAFPLPKDVVVMTWNSHRDPNLYARAGNPVVNASWTPLYIVRNDKRPLEFMFNWKVSQFGREGSDAFTQLDPALADRLIGTQLCSWENSESQEIQHLRERLALMSERSWSPRVGGTFEEFRQRLAKTDAIAEKLLQPVTIKPSGPLTRDESTFAEPMTITLEAKEPGKSIRYTLDNSEPGPHWKPYAGPIAIDKTVWLRAGLFDEAGKQHGYLSGSWFYRTKIFGPNLALNKPVTCGPTPNRTDAWQAKAAVDGRTDKPGLHWASTEPAPQWLLIDLEKVQPLSNIDVVTYWDGSRYYAFTVELSTDGKTWKKVIDASENTIPATAAGYPGSFEKTDARYVRVNVVKSNGNGHAHIVEVVVN